MYSIRFIATYLIVLQFVLLPNIIWAQFIAQSPDLQLTGQVPYVCIGKYANSTIICMQNDGLYEVKKYNNTMAEISRIDVPAIPANCNQLQFVKQGFNFLAMYQVNAQQRQQLYTQLFDSSFKPIAAANLLVNVTNNSDPIIKIAISENKNNVCYYYIADSVGQQYVYLLQQNLTTANSTWQTISIPPAIQHNAIQVHVLNTQQTIVSMHATDNNNLITAAYLYTIQQQQVRQTIVPTQQQLFNYQIQQLDAANQQLVWCFIDANNNQAANCTCTKIVFHAATNTIIKNNTIALTAQTQQLIPAWSAANFLPRQLILAKNGDVVLTTEFVDKQDVVLGSDINSSSIGGPFRITRLVKKYMYNDILVYKFNAQDTLEWVKNISKQQISENDEGAFSSFATVVRKNNVSILFNALDARQTLQLADLDAQGNVVYAIVSDSKVDAKNLVFKKAKQISNNEVIVPSIRQNIFSFVKIRF